MSETNISRKQLDALREISSMSAGNTATSLADIFGKRVDITAPEILVEAVENIPEILGARETVVHVLYFLISGQISGVVFLIFSPNEAFKLVEILTGGNDPGVGNWGELEKSALKEFGNIAVGTYLRILHKNLKISCTPSVPAYIQDMLGAVLDGILARFSEKADYAIILKNNYMIEKKTIDIQFVLILEPKKLKTVLNALG